MCELKFPIIITYEILTKNLGMVRVSPKFIPKVLTEEQKHCRFEVARDNFNMVGRNLIKIINSVQSQVYIYDLETKH